MECNGYRILNYQDSGVSFEALKAALERLGEYLPYTLTELQVDLDEYARKLVAHACIDLALSPDGQVVGIQAYYANDMTTRKAYATFFSLDPECRGTGVAKLMMQLMMDTAKANGMSVLEGRVAKNNARARALYEKFGFTFAYEVSAEKIAMSQRLD
jgi:ribosomal protein S18 acetylase RimI-like enzyme